MSISALIQHTTCRILAERTKPIAITKLFEPKKVAVIGATDRQGSVGKTIVENLKTCLNAKENKKPEETFDIYPINPTRDVCCGLKCYKSIEDCPGPVDIALVVTPASTVPSVVESCGKAQVAIAIVISAGFKELGDSGLELENQVISIARKYNVRIVGPNCLGVMVPQKGLNATFAADHAIPGSIAFLSQSGAMCTAVLDWALQYKIGFSAFVSIGSMADIEWGDFLEYFERDSQTQSIVIYMETIGNVSRFLSAAQCVSKRMPVFVIKAGQTDAAATAAASHTGSLVGSHDAFLAAMRRAGVMAIDTIQEMYDTLLVLGKQPQPAARGNLTIVTNAGGPGVLATDAAALHHANIHPLKPSVIEELNAILPKAWSHANPIDVLGDASATLYAQTLKIAVQDPDSDGILVILSPQSVTEPTPTAKAVIDMVHECAEDLKKKTLLCAWMGSKSVDEGLNLLNAHNIPTFTCPDSAAKIFGQLAKYQFERKQQLNEIAYKLTPESPLVRYTPGCSSDQLAKGKQLIEKVYGEKRTMLTEAESKNLLKIFDLPVAETLIATSQDQAVKFANSMGYPCVMKLHSSTITHKSDVGGVQLNLKNEAQIKQAWQTIQDNLKKLKKEKEFEGATVQPMLDVSNGTELIFGSFSDPQFGPLILFGTGGCMVEIYKDSALGIPPLDIVQSQLLIDSTKISKALKSTEGSRFVPTDFNMLVSLLCRFSDMIHGLSQFVAECDINPMLALPDKLVALDARVVLHDQAAKPTIVQALPAFPSQFSKDFSTKASQKKIKFYISHPSEIFKVKEFVKAYLTHDTGFFADKNKADVTPKLAHSFNLEAHMMPHMLFGNYLREFPISAVDVQTGKLLGCSYLRKHSMNQDCAMLQFAMRPYASVQNDMKQADFDEMTENLIRHTLVVAEANQIKFILSQVFQESEAIQMRNAGFTVDQNAESKLFVCVYDQRK